MKNETFQQIDKGKSSEVKELEDIEETIDPHWWRNLESVLMTKLDDWETQRSLRFPGESLEVYILAKLTPNLCHKVISNASTIFITLGSVIRPLCSRTNEVRMYRLTQKRALNQKRNPSLRCKCMNNRKLNEDSEGRRCTN